MKLMAIALQILASLLRLLPCKQRVAFLSRQTERMSMDYRLLIEELEGRIGADKIVVCLTEPESKDLLKFVSGTLRQLVIACTSKVLVVDGYVPAVSIPKKDPKVTVIQMWHSPGAIKKFGYQCLDTPAGRSSESAKAGRMHMNYDYVISGGPGAAEAFAQAFNYPIETIVNTGLPRIDFLLDPATDSVRNRRAKALREREPFLANGKPTILYAPTLRKGEGYDENWLSHSLGQLASALEAKGDDEAPANLIIAGHPLNNDFSTALLKEHPCIHFISDTATVNLIGVCDCMISDYSAVAFEAALTGVPVQLYVPDLERYTASPGLNVDLLAEAPRSTHTNAGATISAALADALAYRAGMPTGNDYVALTKRYFSGIEYGCTGRIADLVCSHLA